MVSLEGMGIEGDSKGSAITNMTQAFDVAIVGAGWAGLSAAITCIEAGKSVVLFDAAPQAGGRARHLAVQFSDELTVDLDNGQHLLIGAYTSCAAMMQKVGAQPLLRNRLSLQTEAGIFLKNDTPSTAFALWLDARLPAMHKRGMSFLKARGLSITEKFAITAALARLSVGRASTSWDGFCKKNETVEQLLKRLKQPRRLLLNFWNPLCIATMNTMPEMADAATFCRVLRDTFGNPIFEASDFLLPASHLGASFPEPAIEWLQANGCHIHLRTNVTTIHRSRTGSKNIVVNSATEAETIILALPPHNAHRLLKTLNDQAADEKFDTHLEPLSSFDYLPIATVYLAWELPVSVDNLTESINKIIPTIYMLNDLRSSARPGQWLFNRGTVLSKTKQFALASVVVSAWDGSISLEALADQVKQQVASIANLKLPSADFAKAIVDKKATLACTPERARLLGDYLQTFSKNQDPNVGNVFDNIFLAGDYCYPLYPATLEGAVRSGEISAKLALRNK
jgi:hydroxysqualene dehydroxylase